MTNIGANNRTSRSDLSALVVQDPPVLIKRAQTKWPKWVLQLAHRIDLKFCKVAPEIHPLLKALSRNKVDPHEVMMELLYCSNGKAQPIEAAVLNSLNPFQRYRLSKTLESNQEMFEAIRGYMTSLVSSQLVDSEEKQFFKLLAGMDYHLTVVQAALPTNRRRGQPVNPEPDLADPERANPGYSGKAQFKSIFVAAFGDLLRGAPSAAVALEDQLARSLVVARPNIMKPNDATAIRDRFMTTGEVDARTMQRLVENAFRRLGLDDEVQSTIALFDKSTTLLRHRLLDSVLQLLTGPLDLDKKLRLADAHADLLRFSEEDQTFKMGNIAAEFPKAEYAVWAVHDIARRFPAAKDKQGLKTAVKQALQSDGVTQEHALNFMRLLKCTLEGNSAVVREAIAEYAAVPARPRPKTWS